MCCSRCLVLTVFVLLLLPVQARAESAVGDPSGLSSQKLALSDLSDVVHPRVAELKPPSTSGINNGVLCKVTAASPKARKHVKEGYALVHAQWHFEAYRHFCAALAIDPECVMAYAGVALAWIQPFNEYAQYRDAATRRMLELVKADEANIQGGGEQRYRASERRFVAAVAALVNQKPQDAAELFMSLANDEPDCLQAKMIGLFLNRGEYNVANEPSQARLGVLDELRKLMNDHPDNFMLMGFWLMLNSDAPNSSIDIKKEILPYARYLAKECSELPAWQHALGHFEWRVGNYMLAERAFRRAIKLYEKWMAREQVSMGDCEGLIKSKCYLANALYQMGDFNGAIEVAESLRALKPDPSRPQCAGNQVILWRAHHLPARLYLTRDGADNLQSALRSLPTKEELRPYVTDEKFPTLAGVYVEALAAYIGCRQAIEQKSMKDAHSLRNTRLRGLIRQLAAVAEGAMKSPDFTHYFNAGSSLAIYDTELAGLIALADDTSASPMALNHFMSARDKQGVPSLMMPPLVLSPMENRVGDYYHSIGRHADAYEAYYQGLVRYPHNMASLQGVRVALINMGEAQEAERVAEHMKLIRQSKGSGPAN
ncbi:MAG: hypothetical protein ACPHYF_02855 [Akkermansiaceae bacterium]